MRGFQRLLPIALGAPLALLPAPASAGHVGHRAVVVVKPAPSVFPRVVDPWKFWGALHRPPLVHRPRHVVGSPVFLGSFFPAVVSAPPAFAYAPPPNVYVPPPLPAIAVPTPPPTVVEYPTGRYELRGDGVTTPYVWVWIPNPPPPPPPSAAVPPVPPAAPPAPSPPAVEPRPSGPPSEVYHWTDEQGVTHWTNKPNKIPERYRSRAQRLT